MLECRINDCLAPVERRGVTLLEVIVSMAVLVVGLMGMASLIPLGRLEMAEGDRLDNTSTLGRSAFRDLAVRGYLNPQMWAHPVSGYRVAESTNRANYDGSTGYAFNGVSREQLPPFAPLVIDPLMLAPRYQQEGVNASGLSEAESKHRERCQVFPYRIDGAGSGWPDETMPRFARATLRTYPVTASQRMAQSPAHLMRFDLASRVFRSSDDLVIDVPLDRVRRPVQVFAQSALLDQGTSKVTAYDGVISENSVEQVAYRKFRGDYSWFFIVEPNLAERYSDNAFMPNGAGLYGSPYDTYSYRVWVVVCNKRDFRDTSTMDLARDRAVGERCVWIDFMDRYTARLRVSDVVDEGTALRILDVKSNQWIAAISYFENPLLGGKQYVMEWFRIVNAADRPSQVPGTSDWFREVSLAGRDMSSSGTSSVGLRLISAQGSYSYPDVGTPSLNAWGIIIPGVRGVYEKSMYLDRESLYAPQ